METCGGALNTLCYLGDRCTRVSGLRILKKNRAWEKNKKIKNIF
jgi:hypothetical protein